MAITNGMFWQHSQRVLDKLMMQEEEAPAPSWVPHSIRAHREDPESVPMGNYLCSKTPPAVTAAHDTTGELRVQHADLPAHRAPRHLEPAEGPPRVAQRHRGILRPQRWLPRMAPQDLRDVEVRGATIPAGSRVMMVTSMANCDPEMFPDLHTFDLYRDNVHSPPAVRLRHAPVHGP